MTMSAGEAVCDLLIVNARVATMNAARETHDPGAIAIAGRSIVAVGPEAALRAGFTSRRTIDAGGALVHPGLIDTHYHATFHMVGKMIGEADTSKVDPGPWVAKQYVGLLNTLGEEEEYANALLAGLDMLRNGVTCFMDPGTAHQPDTIARAATGLGLRASVAEPWLWDRDGPQLAGIKGAPPGLDRCLDLLGNQLWRNDDPDSLVRGHVAIEGMGSQTDELALAARDCARDAGVPFTMHQSQSIDDTAYDDARFGKHVVLHHRDIGLLDKTCLFSHMNVLRDDEYDAVVDSGMSVVWSINAWYYGTRVQIRNPMPTLFHRGVNVTLGLDVSKAASFGSNQIYTAYLLARDQGDYVSPVDLLQMHTINGARAMRLEDRIGSIEPGKRADIVIRTNSVPEAIPTHNQERQHLIVAGSKSIDTVIVDGEIVVERGHATRVDEQAVYARANEAAARMRTRAGLAS